MKRPSESSTAMADSTNGSACNDDNLQDDTAIDDSKLGISCDVVGLSSEAAKLNLSRGEHHASMSTLTFETENSVPEIGSQESSLCFKIQNGQLTEAVGSVLKKECKHSDLDPDRQAVYSVVKYYQNCLRSISSTSNVADRSKMFSTEKSETRRQILDLLDLLLKSGFDPNIATGTETALMAAVQTHDDRVISLMLEHGADPNLCDGNKEMNAFALAIILNDVEMVTKLIHYGAKINKPCCGEITPLQLSMNKNVDISTLLLQDGADVRQVLQHSTPNNIQFTHAPLIEAVTRRNVYLANVLLEYGEDVNQTTGGTVDTALHIAVKNADFDMAKLLIQYGANLNRLNGRRHTPLGLSLLLEPAEGSRIAQLLLDSGCSRKTETIIALFQRLYPPIFVACFMGNTELVNILLQEDESRWCQSDPLGYSDKMSFTNSDTGPHKERTRYKLCLEGNVLDWLASDGSTPLMMAALGGHIGLVWKLLDRGASPDVVCCHGNLVHAAVMSSCDRSVDLMNMALDRGCSVNLANDYGNTPLHLASRMAHTEICRSLVEQGALLNVKDRFGETALSGSVYFGCEENSRILIQHGAELDIPDTSGTTALYWSIFNGREYILRLLLLAGASFTPEQLSWYPCNLKIMKNQELMTFVRDLIGNPRPLSKICINQIRKLLLRRSGGRSVRSHVMLLPVPEKVKDALLLLDCA